MVDPFPPPDVVNWPLRCRHPLHVRLRGCCLPNCTTLHCSRGSQRLRGRGTEKTVYSWDSCTVGDPRRARASSVAIRSELPESPGRRFLDATRSLSQMLQSPEWDSSGEIRPGADRETLCEPRIRLCEHLWALALTYGRSRIELEKLAKTHQTRKRIVLRLLKALRHNGDRVASTTTGVATVPGIRRPG
jgi:hypothetical protein